MNRFFIIGSPRSGTTLFRLMLNKHKEVIVPPEAGFLTWLYNKYSNYTHDMLGEFIDDLSRTKKIESWNINFSLLKDYIEKKSPIDYQCLIDQVYIFYAEFNLKKEFSWMGDKNNFFLNEIEKIDKIYPDCKFIHIVRDGRSVAASYQGLAKKKLTSKNAPSLSGDICDIAEIWKSDITKIEHSLSNFDNSRVLSVRFEDLVVNSEEILNQVSNFLGVEYDKKMLSYYLTTESEGLEPQEFLDWKSKNSKPLLPEEVNKYKLLSLDDRKAFESFCYDELKRFGYF